MKFYNQKFVKCLQIKMESKLTSLRNNIKSSILQILNKSLNSECSNNCLSSISKVKKMNPGAREH